jgi:hypothetical protein
VGIYLPLVKEEISKHINILNLFNSNIYQFLSLGKEEQNPVVTDANMNKDDLVYFVPRKLVHL